MKILNYIKENKKEVIDAVLGFVLVLAFFGLFYCAMWIRVILELK